MNISEGVFGLDYPKDDEGLTVQPLKLFSTKVVTVFITDDYQMKIGVISILDNCIANFHVFISHLSSNQSHRELVARDDRVAKQFVCRQMALTRSIEQRSHNILMKWQGIVKESLVFVSLSNRCQYKTINNAASS